MVRNEAGDYLGYLNIRDLFGNHKDDETISNLLPLKSDLFVWNTNTLYTALKMMLKKDQDALAVQSGDGQFIGLLTYKDVLSAYKINQGEFIKAAPAFSIKRRGLRILAKGNRFLRERRK